jgi:hypothetical protein
MVLLLSTSVLIKGTWQPVVGLAKKTSLTKGAISFFLNLTLSCHTYVTLLFTAAILIKVKKLRYKYWIWMIYRAFVVKVDSTVQRSWGCLGWIDVTNGSSLFQIAHCWKTVYSIIEVTGTWLCLKLIRFDKPCEEEFLQLFINFKLFFQFYVSLNQYKRLKKLLKLMIRYFCRARQIHAG